MSGIAKPSNASKSYNKLIGLILSQSTVERDGFKWAAKPYSFYAKELGVSVRTIIRLTRAPGIVRDRRKNLTLLRIGEDASKSKDDYARIMSSIWRKKTGAEWGPELRRDFGYIHECIKIWAGLGIPMERSPEILLHVLADWKGFMIRVGAAIDLANDIDPGAATKVWKLDRPLMGTIFDIKEIKPIGRRQGLEIRCVAHGGD